MIEFENVHHYYGARPSVSGLSFRVEPGECVGLLGLNGAGKSTTLRMIAGVSLPSRGVVRVSGKALTASSRALRARIGYLPDTPPLYPDMTAACYLSFAARLRGQSPGAARTATERVLDACGLSRVAHEPIYMLSHGYRQRLGIAQAVVHAPSVVVLDEPSQGLDPAQSLEMRSLVRRLAREHTVVLSTHLLADIRECCHRILLLHQGRLLAQGDERELALRFSGVQGAQITVVARGEQNLLEAALSAVEGLRVASVGVAGDALVFALEAGSDVRAAVSRAVVHAGCELLELHAHAGGLEELFVSLGKERS